MRKLPDWIDRGLKHPMAAATALSLGIKLGQESSKLKSGEINRAEFRRRAGTHVGAVSGTMVGASIGTLLGRVWPGGGHVLGAFMGGMLGEVWGERAGRAAVERLVREPAKDKSTSKDSSHAVEPVEDSKAELNRRNL
ncbi:MAG: hypothetical protein AAFN74_00090 [Myxococcota bacterium]